MKSDPDRVSSLLTAEQEVWIRAYEASVAAATPGSTPGSTRPAETALAAARWVLHEFRDTWPAPE